MNRREQIIRVVLDRLEINNIYPEQIWINDLARDIGEAVDEWLFFGPVGEKREKQIRKWNKKG